MRYFILSLLLSVSAFARAPGTIPNPRFQGTWIVDEGGVLSAEEKRQLDQELDGLQRDTGAEFAIVVLNSIGDAVPKQFATALFQSWGIGKQGSDNGLLLLLVLDQRRSEFETGYGLEGILTDVKLAHILREKMTPRFRAKDMGDGIRAGAAAVIEELRANAEEVRGRGHSRRTFLPVEFYILEAGGASALLLLLWIGLARLRRKDPYELSESFGAGSVILWYLGMLTLAFEAAFHELRFKQEWISLAPGGAVFLGFIFSRVSFERWRGKLRFAPRICTACGKVMQRLTLPTDQKRCLNHNQQVEQDIQSVNYETWHCSCGKNRADAYPGVRAGSFQRCENCHSLADERVSIEKVKAASFFSTGLEHHHYCCRACGNTRIVEYRPPSQGSDSSSGSGGSSGSSSSSSDFGGGSSGGGGAGDSW